MTRWIEHPVATFDLRYLSNQLEFSISYFSQWPPEERIRYILNMQICIFFSPSDNLIITDLHALLTPTSNSTSPAVIGGAHMSLKHSVLRITLQLSRLVLRLYYISYCDGVALENKITGCSYYMYIMSHLEIWQFTSGVNWKCVCFSINFITIAQDFHLNFLPFWRHAA